MTKTKKIISSLAAIALIVMAGCEWSTPSSEDTWTMNGYDWFDFSGTYRGVDGSPIVSGFTYENPTEQGIVNGELVASLSSSKSNFGGSFNHNSVIPSSVTIYAGDYAFVDNGAGSLYTSGGGSGVNIEKHVTGEILSEDTDPGLVVLSGTLNYGNVEAGSVRIVMNGETYADDGSGNLTSASYAGTIAYGNGSWSINFAAGDAATVYADYTYYISDAVASGTISYQTGAWSINLADSTVSGNVTASYAYTLDQPFEPGNTGTPIVTLSIAQVGNKLTIYDSAGRTFNGTIGVANGSGGTSVPTSDSSYSTYVTAQFTAYYGDIEIIGTLTGLYTYNQPGVFFQRTIQAVWIEPTVQGDVFGEAEAIEVAEFVEATDTTIILN